MYLCCKGVLLVIIGALLLIGFSAAQTCEISINTDTNKKIPMFVDRSDGRTILVPNSGKISLKKGDSIYLTCPGNSNEVVGYSSKMVLATCSIGNLFFINGNTHPVPITKIECQQSPQSYAALVGICSDQGKLMEIGFELSNTQNPQIQVCFDMELKRTHWVKSLNPGLNPGDCNNTDISSLDKVYFGTINPDDRYSKQYLDTNYRNNLVKSQLISRCEFADASRKQMTHYYINTIPVWKPLHLGNWNNLDTLVKHQGISKNATFYQYSGTHDVLQFRGKNVTLDSSGKMPVPLYVWKVIIEVGSGKGVAFVGVNDVYQLYPTICTDFCHHITWLDGFQQSRKSLKDGIVYCCAIDDLEEVPGIVLPDFTEWQGTFLY